MAWPDDRDLPIDVEAAFGADVQADPGTWSWTSLTSRLRADPIRLRAGKSGGAAQVSPGTCSVTLDNDDSALTPLHPISPYWPNVELGTPLRVRLRRVEDTFARTTVGNSWGTSDSGEAWSVGGTGASVSGGVARHSHTDVGNIRVTTLPVSLTDSEQVADIAPSALLTGAALVTGFVFRYAGGSAFYWLRCEFNPGGTTVMLKITRYTTAGGYVDLATLNPVPSLAYAANSYMRVRASVVGTRMAIKVWPAAGTEPSGWHLTATDSVVTAPGKVGFQSWLVAGNSNALPVVAQHKNYTVHVDRFSGHADQWEPTFVPTGVDGEMSSAVRVTASGILRRLGQGASASRSALQRTIAESSPLAYYPAEDGITASSAGSALPGQGPLTVLGDVEFRPVDDYQYNTKTTRYGTSALADLAAGGAMEATLHPSVAAATTASWTVHVIAKVDPSATNADVIVLDWTTPGGTYTRWQLAVIKATGHTQVNAYTAALATTIVINRPAVVTSFTTWAVSARQVGGNIEVTYWLSATLPLTATIPGTLGGVASVAVNTFTRATSSVPMPFGHLAVWAAAAVPYPTDPFLDSYGEVVESALRSHVGEAANNRLARLAAEDDVALDMPAVDAGAVTRMGWQDSGAPLDLYRESEDADIGILYERGFRLAYLPRVARYNQPAALTIDLATYAITNSDREPLKPVYDDQNIRNEWTVERREGSFAVASDPVSQRRGTYPDSVELNLADDSQLPDQASWRVHLTSEPDLREATFPIDLAANPQLLDGWLSCQVGSRIVRTNPPAQHRPGSLDRLVEGWTETIGPRAWLVQVVPAQAKPWDVATADGPQRAAGDSAALGVALGVADTAAAITATPENGPWTQNPANFPLPVRIGGEQVTVSAIAPVLTETFTRTVSGGWGSPDAGPAYVVAPTPSQFAVGGGEGLIGVNATNTTFTATAAGIGPDFDVTVRLRADAVAVAGFYQQVVRYRIGTGYIESVIRYKTTGQIDLLLQTQSTVLATNANVLTYGAGAPFLLRVQAFGSTVRHVLRPTTAFEPAWSATSTNAPTSGDGFALAGFRESSNTQSGLALAFDSVTFRTPQRATISARGVNGVQRAWPVGTEVNVWQPAVAAL